MEAVAAAPVRMYPAALPVGARIGRYEIRGTLGVGGVAAVYLCRERDSGTLRALKVLVLDRPSIRRRFVREGRVQARLRHPNVVRVLDTVECDGLSGIVLEHVDGVSLDHLLATRRPTLPEADRLVRGILRGVAAAHAKGLVHRDLKPGNVLVQRVGDHLVPKIADFGIVKVPFDDPRDDDGTRTRTGITMGTPGYMSPEQIADASCVDGRSDVWSLGVMMAELCTGELPFAGLTPIDVHRAMAAGYTPPAWLPERMARAIGGALQPDLRFRTGTVEALLAAWCGDVGDDEIAPESPETLAAAVATATRGASAPTVVHPPAAPTVPTTMSVTLSTPSMPPGTGKRLPKGLAAAPTLRYYLRPGRRPGMGDAAGLVGAIVGLLGLAGVTLAVVARVLGAL